MVEWLIFAILAVTSLLNFAGAGRRHRVLQTTDFCPAPNHLSFHGGSRENIDQLRQDLLARGVKLLYDDRYPFAGGENHYALYCEDPDGIKIEVVKEKRR